MCIVCSIPKIPSQLSSSPTSLCITVFAKFARFPAHWKYFPIGPLYIKSLLKKWSGKLYQNQDHVITLEVLVALRNSFCRCVSKDQDPCSMGLCEQQCTVYLQRIICTCFDGYRFSPENQKLGRKPVCVGKDFNRLYL